MVYLCTFFKFDNKLLISKLTSQNLFIVEGRKPTDLNDLIAIDDATDIIQLYDIVQTLILFRRQITALNSSPSALSVYYITCLIYIYTFNVTFVKTIYDTHI